MIAKKPLAILLFILLLFIGTANASISLIDGFEDGDYTNNPNWNVYGPERIEVQSEIVKNGEYAIKLAGGGPVGVTWIKTPIVDETNVDAISFWLRVNNAYGAITLAQNTLNGNYVGFSIQNGRFYYYYTGAHLDSGITVNTNTWYKLKWVHTAGSNIVDYYVYWDEAETQLVFKKEGIPVNSALGQEIHFGAYGSPLEVYLDDITYGNGSSECGNSVCEPGETCETCAVDCGSCPVDLLEQRVSVLETLVSEQESEIGALNLRVDTLETENQGLQENMNALSSQVGLLDSAVSALQSAFEGFQNLILSLLGGMGKSDRELMVCSTLNTENPENTLLGLNCVLDEKAKCKCTEI